MLGERAGRPARLAQPPRRAQVARRHRPGRRHHHPVGHVGDARASRARLLQRRHVERLVDQRAVEAIAVECRAPRTTGARGWSGRWPSDSRSSGRSAGRPCPNSAISCWKTGERLARSRRHQLRRRGREVEDEVAVRVGEEPRRDRPAPQEAKEPARLADDGAAAAVRTRRASAAARPRAPRWRRRRRPARSRRCRPGCRA